MASLDLLRRRGRALELVRRFFGERGYLEVDTPCLAPFLIPERHIGSFRTRYLAAGTEKDLFLVPSPELWMKRLLAAGCGSIFQVGRAFRNGEPRSPLHEPEFTMLEWYTADHGYLDSIAVTEELVSSLLEGLQVGPRVEGRRGAVDWSAPFIRLTVEEAFRRHAGLELAALSSRPQIGRAAAGLGLAVGPEDDWADLFHKMLLALVEPELPRDRPVVLLDYPQAVPTLARARGGTPWAERWELYAAGVEVANCFTEEGDPERVAAFVAAEARHGQRRPGAPPADVGLPRAGALPLCSGVALGVDRLLMLLFGCASIQEVIPFPLSGQGV